MTAPFKRTATEDQVGTHQRRIRSLEANRFTDDAVPFDWAWDNATIDHLVIGYGGTDPSGFAFLSGGYVTGNLVATCNVWMYPIGGFSAGTGSQYLIPLGQLISGSDQPYYPDTNYWVVGGTGQNPVMGYVESYDDSGLAYTRMAVRVSQIDYAGDGSPYLEAYDPGTGNLWGPTSPYTWATDDIMLGGVFQYRLAQSLLDTIGG